VAEVICETCGHPNPLGANFCSSCGSGLGDASEKTTVSLQAVPGPETGEELSIDLSEIPSGVGVLVVQGGPKGGSRFVLDQDVTTAGRHPDSHIFLDDITVSRRHAEVLRTPDGYRVRDVGSLNGTYLNRERIEEGKLESGDDLQVGKYKLVFLTGAG
jgi:hypothetical protein